MFLLGGFRLERADGAAVAISRRKSQALLALLALRPTHSYAREELTALLWAESTDEQARHSLRQVLHELRGTLARTKVPVLSVDGDRVALDADAIDVDVAQFERLAGENAPSALERAAALYAGDLLLGLTVPDEEFEQRLRDERERLRQRALGVLKRLLDHQVKAQRSEPAIETALRLLAMDPTHEPVHGTLMRLYARVGQRAAAFKQYQVCVDVLQRELGVEPEPATRRLYQELLATARAPHVSAVAPLPVRRAGRPAAAVTPSLDGDPPLVGRQAELARLSELLDGACQRRGQTIAIVGEAGVGKSRLVTETLARFLARDGRMILGRAYETARVLAFGPWVDALRAGLAMDPGAVAALEPTWRTELGRLLPDLGGRAMRTSPTDATRLFQAVACLLERLAAQRPLLIVLEDVHWADEPTLRLAAYVARHIDRAPILLMVTVREEELADAPLLGVTLAELREHAHLTTIALPPLSEADTRTLARSLSRAEHDQAVLAALDEQAWRTSGGNPLVVLEIVRALHERSAGAPAAVALPTRVRELVTTRLERLSERARLVVSIAGVIGREFDFPLLQRCAGLDDRDAAEVVEELVRRRVFHGVGERLDFTHDRIRAIASGRLLPAQTRPIHRLIATSLESVCAADLEPHYAALAAHWGGAEVWDKAAGYLFGAGTIAADRFAHRDAAAAFDEALRALARVPESRQSLEQAVDIRLALHTSCYALGELERGYAALRDAGAPARALGDARRSALLASQTGQYFWVTGRVCEALPLFEHAVSVARSIDDFALLMSSTLYLATSRFSLGDLTQAERLFRSVVDTLTGAGAGERLGLHGFPLVFAHSGLTAVYAEQGRFDEARAHGEASLRTAEALNQAYSLVFALRIVGHAHTVEGHLAEALAALERGMALCRDDASVRSLAPNIMASLGYAQALSGQVQAGIGRLEEALTTLDGSGHRVWYVLVLNQLAEAALLGGDTDRARACAARAVALAHERGERGFEAGACRVMGAVAATAPLLEMDKAQQSYVAALALAEERQMRPLMLRCHAGLASLYARLGERDAAQRHRAEAQAIAGALGIQPPAELRGA